MLIMCGLKWDKAAIEDAQHTAVEWQVSSSIVSLNDKELEDWYAIAVSTEPRDRTESAVKG
jgi:hypothetical protein